MPKSRSRMSGCLTNTLLLILLAVLAFFIYKWVTSLGSANMVITKLSVTEKIGRSGNPIEESKLVTLHLTNTGNQPGKFTLDTENYKEAQQLEGQEIKGHPKLWTFRTELYFSGLDEWKEYANSEIWSGNKITPGALEIAVAVQETLELEAYIKSSRGWQIPMPEIAIESMEEAAPEPSRLRIGVISPKGETVLTEEADL
ncbi:MAG: hypothetical protein GF310_13155 [candidate division Zixibacteria bacterium]|nr:hypothetical protein [candidate division Zixibacteria bacterium]